LIPALARFGADDVVMNTAITRDNLPVLRANYERAKEWGVSISYSAYTPLRTGDWGHYIGSPQDLEVLQKTMQELLQVSQSNGRITNSPWTLTGTYDFFKNGRVPGCKAGRRFLVVNPDGTLRGCSMFDHHYSSLQEVREKFVANNTCGECYVSIRAYLDASYGTLLKDNVRKRVFAHRNGHSNSCS
ncbi:MAG TPA: hypothetical protein VLR94_11615, partial [Acidobacteriota bacterium]|nr:hypothetical protein [Acidobacteriota bacterium]